MQTVWLLVNGKRSSSPPIDTNRILEESEPENLAGKRQDPHAIKRCGPFDSLTVVARGFEPQTSYPRSRGPHVFR